MSRSLRTVQCLKIRLGSVVSMPSSTMRCAAFLSKSCNESSINKRVIISIFLRRGFNPCAIVLLIGATLSISVTAANKYPSLNMHGSTYPNACSKPEQQVLRQAILKAKVQKLPAVWRAVQALLCAPRTGPEHAYLGSMFAKKIKQKQEDTGSEPSHEVVARTDELIDRTMAAGEAWDANLDIEVDKIRLQYFPNEACVRSVTLSYRQTKWVIDEIDEACD